MHQHSDSELGHHQVIIPVLELAPVCETVDLSHRDPLEMDMLVQGGAPVRWLSANNSNFTMVYGRYINTPTMVHKPTNITVRAQPCKEQT